MYTGQGTIAIEVPIACYEEAGHACVVNIIGGSEVLPDFGESARRRRRRLARTISPCVVKNPNETWADFKHAQVFSEKFPRCWPVAADAPRTDGNVRIVCISDMHGIHRQVHPPAGDLLIVAGDISDRGNPFQVLDFIEWIRDIDFRIKIVIAGNHDIALDKDYYLAKGRRKFNLPEINPDELINRLRSVCTYLDDKGVTIFPLEDGSGGIHIWGCPWVPRYSDTAFGRKRGKSLYRKWTKIPTESDVLVVHAPPLGRGDLTSKGGRTGCPDLLRQIQERVKPQLVVHGHIHEGYGFSSDGVTTFVNASTIAPRNLPPRDPIVLDFIPPRAIDKSATSLRYWL